MAAAGCRQAGPQGQAQGEGTGGSAGAAAAALPQQATDGQTVEDRVVLAVSRAIRTYKLSSLADECLAYRFEEAAGEPYYEVEVRENHRYAMCGGDPKTSPMLFRIRVTKAGGEMSTDRGSAAGEFRRLGS